MTIWGGTFFSGLMEKGKFSPLGSRSMEGARRLNTRQTRSRGHAVQPPGVHEANLGVFFETYNISQREQEIIHLLIQGKKSYEIADLLYISKHTVKNHVYSIYQKVGVKNRVELSNFIHDFPTAPPASP